MCIILSKHLFYLESRACDLSLICSTRHGKILDVMKSLAKYLGNSCMTEVNSQVMYNPHLIFLHCNFSMNAKLKKITIFFLSLLCLLSIAVCHIQWILYCHHTYALCFI